MNADLAVRDEAMRAFITTLSALEETGPTWCPGWSVHYLTAHVAAAAEERANLIEDYLAGKPGRATRSWEVREPPFRAMPDAALRQKLVEQAVRFEPSAAALNTDDAIVYTGWAMTAERLCMQPQRGSSAPLGPRRRRRHQHRTALRSRRRHPCACGVRRDTRIGRGAALERMRFRICARRSPGGRSARGRCDAACR